MNVAKEEKLETKPKIPPKERKQKKFLLIRTDKIGDVISITPAASILRKNFPKAHISALVSPYTKDILQNNTDIDEVITDDKPLKLLAPLIKAKRFDTAIVFFVDKKSALIPFLAGIKLRIGPASKIWSVLFNKMIFQHRSKKVKQQIDFNVDLLAPLFVYKFPATPKVILTKEEKSEAKKYLKDTFELKTKDALICIHPGSKGSALDWPEKHYAKLIDLILKKHNNVKILLTGAQNEQRLLNRIYFRCSAKKPLVLSDTKTLREFCAIIDQADITISNSTGPLHIAAALGKPTVSFYPKLKNCSKERWGPYGKEHIILEPILSEIGVREGFCFECKDDKCIVQCMETINPSQAFTAVEKQLAKVLK